MSFSVKLDIISYVKLTLTPKLGVFRSCCHGGGYFPISIVVYPPFFLTDIKARLSFTVVSSAPGIAPETGFNKYILNEEKKKRLHFSLYFDLPDKIWLWVYQQLGVRKSVEEKDLFKHP